MRKIPFAGIELTSQRVRGLRGTSDLPGRPASDKYIGFGLRIETGTKRTTIVCVYVCVFFPLILDFNVIQTVRDTGIHLEVDEKQWSIARGSKRQAGGPGFLASYLSRLRHTDAPHA